MGVLEDIVVTIASSQYQIDFFVIYPKNSKLGHPVVLGQHWFATTNAVIGCINGEMIISNGSHNQALNFFPPAQIAAELPLWLKSPFGDKDYMFPLLTLGQS